MTPSTCEPFSAEQMTEAAEELRRDAKYLDDSSAPLVVEPEHLSLSAQMLDQAAAQEGELAEVRAAFIAGWNAGFSDGMSDYPVRMFEPSAKRAWDDYKAARRTP